MDGVNIFEYVVPCLPVAVEISASRLAGLVYSMLSLRNTTVALRLTELDRLRA
jgi:hypothetical protein